MHRINLHLPHSKLVVPMVRRTFSSLIPHRRLHVNPIGIIAVIGLIAYLVARITTRGNDPVGLSVQDGGFMVAVGGLIMLLRPRIGQVSDKSKSRALWAAWWIAAISLIIIASGVMLDIVGQRRGGYYITGLGFTSLMLLPLTAYFFLVTFPEIGRARAAAVAATALLSASFLFIFPAMVIILINAGPPAYWFGPQTGSWGEFTILISIPSILVFMPRLIAATRPWTETEEDVQVSVSGLLADFAAGLTIVYAVLLHYGNGPLRHSPFDGLAAAIVFTVALLRPLFKAVATQYWRGGATTMLSERKVAALFVIRAIRDVIAREMVDNGDAHRQDVDMRQGPSLGAAPDR